MKKIVYVSIVLAVTGLLALSCSKDDGPTTPEESTDPQITSFSPTSGDHGTTVEITGKNFASKAAGNKVSFNGQTATINAATSTLLTVIVPEGAITGKIEVEVDGAKASSSTNFSVVDQNASINVDRSTDHDNNNFEKGETITIEVNVSAAEGISSFEISKDVNDGIEWSNLTDDVPSLPGTGDTEFSAIYEFEVNDNENDVVKLVVKAKDKDDVEFQVGSYTYNVVAQGQGGSGGKYPLLNVYNNLETPITLGSQGNFEIGSLFNSSNGDVYTNELADELEGDDRQAIDMAFGVLGFDGNAGGQFPNLISPHLLEEKQFENQLGIQASETTFRAEEEMNFGSITSTDVDQNIDHSTGTVLDNIAITKDGIYSFVNEVGVKGYIQVISVTGSDDNRTAQLRVLSQILP